MSQYTEELVKELHALADGNGGTITYAMAVTFADEKGLKPRSVIAKTKSEKIAYEPKPARVTKAGEPVVRKAQFVEAIETAVEVSVPSLAKVTKADLEILCKAVGAEMPEPSA